MSLNFHSWCRLSNNVMKSIVDYIKRFIETKKIDVSIILFLKSIWLLMVCVLTWKKDLKDLISLV